MTILQSKITEQKTEFFVTTIPVFMENPMYNKIYNRVLDTYPNACILCIENVINPQLQSRYDILKVENITATELQLFHGTENSNVAPIIERGFLSSLNINSAYGKGSYFARDASLSKGYMKDNTAKQGNLISYMFLCDILLLSPSWDKKNGIYVVPNDSAIYPTFFIKFHKDAQ
jgi:hypothetical protein